MNAALLIHGIFGRCDHTYVDGHHRVRLHDHAIELQFHPPLAHKMARILVLGKLPDKVAAVRKLVSPIGFKMAELTQNRIPDVLCF